MKDRSAIIIAGGKSERFQRFSKSIRDKALEKLSDKTLLEHVVGRVAGVVDDVIITVDNDLRRKTYERLLREAGVEGFDIFVDDDQGCIGPLRGMMTGFRRISGEHVVTLPCDVPFIKPEIVDFLFELATGYTAAVPVWPSGRLEPLIGIFERETALYLAEVLCGLGRSRPDDLYRALPSVVFISIVEDLGAIDPALESFVNINYPWDLEKLPRPTVKEGLFKKTVYHRSSFEIKGIKRVINAINTFLIKRGNTWEEIDEAYEYASGNDAFFWAGVIKEFEGKTLRNLIEEEKNINRSLQKRMRISFTKAAENFRWEAEPYISKGILFLAAHALLDEEACWRGATHEDRAAKAGGEAWRLYGEMDLDTYRRRGLEPLDF